MRVRGQSCRIQRCKRRPSVDGLCRTHATEEADKLFSLAIRSYGQCQIEDGRPCNGNLQCMHILSRSFRAVRWDNGNALCGCASHHTYYTHNPAGWFLWVVETIGMDEFQDLYDRAHTHIAPDLELVLAELRAAA